MRVDDQMKDKVVAGLLAALLGVFSLWALVKPADEASVSERRELAQFPQVSAKALASGKFMGEFDEYAADQFPLRDAFRQAYAAFSFGVMGKSDVDGLFLADGSAVALEYPMDPGSVAHASEVFAGICGEYGLEPDRTFAVAIPDKAYFLQDDPSVLTMDYQAFYAEARKLNPQMMWIDACNLLELGDYYATDPHWRQECIFDVAQRVAGQMGVALPDGFEENLATDGFKGTYAQQIGLPMPGEPLIYMTGAPIANCRVFDHQNNREIGLYDLAKVQDRDPYELFLSGPLSYVTIENPDAATDRELIVFRDSFGSALASYLAAGYAKVTLLDVRYLPSASIPDTVDFEDADVLFAFSTSVLNNSSILK